MQTGEVRSPHSLQTRIYGHENATRKKGTRLKKRHCVIHIFSFVIRHTRVAISIYTALFREAEVIVAELTGQDVSDVDAL